MYLFILCDTELCENRVGLIMPNRTQREYRRKNNANPHLNKAMCLCIHRTNERESSNLIIAICLTVS